MEVKEQEPYANYISSPSLFSTGWWSKDTVAIVTGANKGIGYSIGKQLAESGLTVILTARDVEKGRNAIEQLRKRHDGRSTDLHLHFYCLDVSDPASIQAFVLQFQKDFGVLDILVNNAGVSFNDIQENNVDHAETVIKTNFYGAKLLIESILPFFRRSNFVSRILNISSRLGSVHKMRNPTMKKMLQSENLTEEQIEGMVNLFLENVKKGTWESQGWPQIWTDYAVSKLALNAYSRVLARRYKDCGLSVNCFCPGFTRTSMTGGKGTHTADDAAGVGAKLLLLPPQELPTGKFYIGFSPGIVSRLQH